MSDATRTAEIFANLQEVQRRITEAALRVNRDPAEVQLVAVSKTYPIEDIAAVLSAGQRDFGENRLEELWPKIEQARRLGMDDIRWHMIGTIQSRKSSDAVGPVVLIHSVDRAKIAQRLSRDAVSAGCVLDVLLEVNVSGEASKHGFIPDELYSGADELLALPGLRIQGLMTMAPYESDPETTRPVFRTLRQLRDDLTMRFSQGEWQTLSMGMTNDFEVAIEEGATIVRIGSAIFGTRNG